MKYGFLLVLAWCAQVAYGDSATDVLQSKLNAMHTMSAKFTQVVQAKKRQVSRSSGTMALERPGRFRWHTKTPMAQLVVADGKRLWVYDVDLEQVTVKKQAKGIGGTAALFLSGYDDTLQRDFEVKTHKKGQLDYFDLQAKSPKANFQRVTLMYLNDQLTGLELFDQLGQRTEVHFSHIKTNLALAPKLFRFKAPKGTDVVQQ